MNIRVMFLSSIVYESKSLDGCYANIVFNLMIKHKKLLPKSYNRSKQMRKYCYNIDIKISTLIKDEIFFSSYSGDQYKLVLVE